MYKIVLWGLGEIYNKMLNTIHYYEMKKEFEIIAVTANEIPSFCKIDSYPLIKKEKIMELDFDYLIIMNRVHYQDILDEVCNNIKMDRNKVLNYRVLEIPNLKFADYIRLKESNISIVSNNCWGGFLYNTLALECKSPFKNCFFIDEEYIKLINNLEYYLSMQPTLSEYVIEPHNHMRYPVLTIGDIHIHCNHDTDADIAISNWNRRKEKINWNNLFFEMYTKDAGIEKEFNDLKYQNKVCFVPHKSDCPCSIQLPILPGQKEFYETVNSNATIKINGYIYGIVEILSNSPYFRCE